MKKFKIEHEFDKTNDIKFGICRHGFFYRLTKDYMFFDQLSGEEDNFECKDNNENKLNKNLIIILSVCSAVIIIIIIILIVICYRYRKCHCCSFKKKDESSDLKSDKLMDNDDVHSFLNSHDFL